MPTRLTLLRLLAVSWLWGTGALLGHALTHGKAWGVGLGSFFAVLGTLPLLWALRAFPFRMLVRCPFCGVRVSTLEYRPVAEGMRMASEPCGHVYLLLGEWTPWRSDLGPPEPWGPFEGWAFRYDLALTVVRLDDEGAEIERRRTALPAWIVRLAAA